MKKLVISLVILLVILIMITIFLGFSIKGENQQEENPNSIEEPLFETTEELKNEMDINTYFGIEKIIQNYMAKLEQLKHPDQYQENKEDVKQRATDYLYSIIGKQFLTEKNVKKENLSNYLSSYNEYYFEIQNMYSRKQGNDIYMYIIEGKIDKIIKRIVVVLDNQQQTFAIYPEDFIQEKSSIQIEERIEKNEYNKYTEGIITIAYIANRHMLDVKKYLEDPNQFYQILDENYREKRFGSLEKFNEYLENNKERFRNMEPAQYINTFEEKNNKYICTDMSGNYYIFKDNAAMKYTVMLDSYTIEQEEMIQKYKEVNSENKGAMQLEKIKEALNNQDYAYVYRKLADSFKSNYFPTQQSFENYVKTNFYHKNKFEYTNYELQVDNQMYTVKITNSDKQEETMEKTFVVKLEGETDFVFSFGVN